MWVLWLVSMVLAAAAACGSTRVKLGDETIRDAVRRWYEGDAEVPMSCWDVSEVTNMDALFAPPEYMLLDSSYHRHVRDRRDVAAGALHLETWDVSSVRSMVRMFADMRGFNSPLGRWNVSSVRSMRGMFYGARAFNQSLNDWDVSGVTDMSYMFAYATAFDPNHASWRISEATNTQNMFL